MTEGTWPDLQYWRAQAQRLERDLQDAQGVIDLLRAEIATLEGSVARPSPPSDPVQITDAEPNAPR